MKNFFRRLFRREPEWVKCEVRRRVNGQYFAVDFYSNGSQQLRELSSECQDHLQDFFALGLNPCLAAADDRFRSEAREITQELESILVRIKDGEVHVL